MTIADAPIIAETPVLLRQVTDGVATLTLNRPKARNSLSEALLAELQATFDDIASDRAVRTVIISAAGPGFCAGHDLKEMTPHRDDADHGQAYFTELLGRCSKLMQSIVHCPKPVIAQVQGAASAAGCQLVASCDLAVAADGAKFALPGVNIGLFCSTPMVAVSRNVARKHAMELLLTGEMMTAQKAFEIGLVNRVVPDHELAEEALSLARKIASKSTKTLAIGKEAFYRQLELGLAEAYEYTTDVMIQNMMCEDAGEGIEAFLAKRQPEWKDR